MTDADPEAPYGRKKDGSPRKPTGFQKGGSHYKAPRSVSGDKNGPGWGGASKGQNPRHALFDSTTGVIEGAKDGAYHRARLADKDRLADDMMVVYLDVIETTEFDATKLAAADRVLNRLQGLPVARSISDTTVETRQLTLNVDLMAPEQRDELRATLLRARQSLIEHASDNADAD